jgi:hypothetical protein
VRNGGAQWLLFTAIGALVALLIVFFGGEEANLPGRVTVPASPATSNNRVVTTADESANGTDLERDVAEGAGPTEDPPLRSRGTESPSVGPIDTDRDGAAARSVAAKDRPSAMPRSGANTAAGFPLSWCFRARNGFTWQENGAASGSQHGFSSDTSVVWQGSASARIGAAGDSLRPDTVGVMWQAVVATPLRGKRVEMSASVRPRIAQVGHLFVRTQANVPLELLVSDQNAPGARGINQYVPRNAEWERYRVVHDVPPDAEVMYYGFALYGSGLVWIDDVRISIVDGASGLSHYGSVAGNPAIPIDPSWVLPVPLNLDFELTSDGPTGGAEASHPDCREAAH